MKAKQIFWMLIVASVAILVGLWSINTPIVAIGMSSGLITLWVIYAKHHSNIIDEHYLLIDRVQKLKSFSHDLQELIDHELALVQEDVLRTRNIVSDSIDILQAASLSIHATALQQEGQLLHLAANQAQASQHAQVNNSIQSVSSADSNGSMVVNDIQFQTFSANNASLKMNADQLMQALQFEDIVSQVSQRVAEHVGDIQQTVNILSNLCDSELSSTFEEDIEKMNMEYLVVKEKLVKVSSKKIAAQENMDEGDIDLF